MHKCSVSWPTNYCDVEFRLCSAGSLGNHLNGLSTHPLYLALHCQVAQGFLVSVAEGRLPHPPPFHFLTGHLLVRSGRAAIILGPQRVGFRSDVAELMNQCHQGLSRLLI